MTEPLVSVNMITYNHAPYIAQAIEGVLQQKGNFPVELVIGEDCSTDGTREIVLEYQKKHPDIIRVITSDKNVGMIKNGSRTQKACRGKYIAFCEGDDYWHHPYKLQKQVDYLESHPECGLVYSSFDVYYVKSKKLIKDFIRHRKWDMLENPDISGFVSGFLEGKNGLRGISTCTVMVRRNLYEQIIESDPYLYESGHFLMGDTQLWAEFIAIAGIHYIPESLATYRRHEGSASNPKDIKQKLKFAILGSELMLYLCDKYNLPLSIRNEHEAKRCNSLLRLAFHERSKELADEVLKMKRKFTCDEWLRYLGAKNLVFYYFLRVAGLFRNLFGKVHR